MLTETPMNVNERRKYINLMKPRYLKAAKAERSVLLSEMEQVTGMHRKSLTRLINARTLERKKRTGHRQRTYGGEVEQVIVCVWESLDYICAERLTPTLLATAKHLERFGVLTLSSVGGRPVADDQPSECRPAACQASLITAALTAQRTRASQSSHQRRPDGPDCLEYHGARPF